MAQLIVSTRMAGKRTGGAAAASLDNFDAAARVMGAFSDTLGERAPTDSTRRRTLFLEGELAEFRARAHEFHSDVLVEPVLHRTTAVTGPLQIEQLRTPPAALPLSARATTPEAEKSLGFTVRGGGEPAANAKVELFLIDSQKQSTTMEATTGADGSVRFQFDGAQWTAAYAMITPAGGYWSTIAVQPDDGSVVSLTPLPMDGPLGWWHRLVGMNSVVEGRGAGVRVGVVDTGVGPHPALEHVRSVGAFIGGAHDGRPAAGLDARDHGSHVCGIIGARPPAGSGGYVGLASDADVVSARVFGETQNANQGDIAHAIEFLAEVEAADLINMSLGGPSSRIEADAIATAVEFGTLSICAAGNEGGAVSFPAALPDTAAVSALGVNGTVPSGSIDGMNVPTSPDRKAPNGLYLASFSNFGGAVSAAGPGVGIISTVPGNADDPAPYAAMSGTSMACPVATGALASLLSMDPAYLGLPRGLARAARASAIQAATARQIGLARPYEGAGLVRSAP
ncbi:MAG: S8 family serine peptidase [Planctomycetota bacterium]